MIWSFTIRNIIYPKEKRVWVQVRIICKTDRAILVDNGIKSWILKSQGFGIRLKNAIFEIYVKESSIG